MRWEYDGFGRMTERHDSHRGTVQRFSYDDEHRISQVIIEGDAEFTRAEYRYDALGRRTEKQVWRRHTRNAERTQYAWSGLQMVGECSDSNPDAAVQYIYTENSYEPLARVDSRGEHAEVYWYHTELNGLPEKVTDSSGDIVWQGVSTTWGRSERENSNADWDVPQNLRFQGQYLDRETGLHYNTFRYYDPCGGRYTQMDPIGLLGGLNTYTYVVDPLGWVDPWGLVCWSTAQKNYWKDVGADELANPSGLYSQRNILEMLAGRAPKFTAKVQVIKTGQIQTRDIPYELHHKNIPQRQGGPGVHNKSNLDELDPWQHQDVDKYRHSGIKLIEVITGVNSW
ncbi:RHS repeat-associated core domain-containing protein [Kosakonia sacchari]|uniref:RHS repeat-associated core domain-containing protein n=1 Tax=Kosakonia sacchari TaxID=1158459 RepID=A0A1G4Z5J3_9ENTR|nr:RHS repeat-associated core domain-containing protein [Kosakonia sacchari]